VAILDGNVKRVLTRVLGYGQDLAVAAHEKALWGLAQDLLPEQDLSTTMPRYTQGLMDLGATVCTTRRPQCLLCPLQSMCVAARNGQATAFPVRTKKLKRSAQSLWLLWAQDSAGRVWLQQRPERGIWARLYTLPLFESESALSDQLQGLPGREKWPLTSLPAFTHVLTHKDLHLHPVRLEIPSGDLPFDGGWVAADRWPVLGLPAPVRQLLEGRASSSR
jgi:A/G-specific adenine glycosylase